MNGKLYLVATPIGNLEDITLRALRILKEVDYIAAEDTRNTLKLLNHFEIKKPLISNHRHNEEDRENSLIEKLKDGKNIAVVSDAGTPGISDPGEVIAKRAIEENIEVIPIPGACAAINALIASGLDTKEFVFYGNLEHGSGSVKHMGDNLTGEGDGDDEQILIDLSKVPSNVEKIAFTVTILLLELIKVTFS